VIDPARSFDLAADEYERTRPDYPPEVLDPLPLSADAKVLDVGAGTGKLTRVLVGRYRHVVAVEPLDGMRAILERVVPRARAVAGTAEAIPLPDASVDAGFAAQAFHWFAHDEAIPELARVIRGGGVLCLVWNEGDDSRQSPLPQAYEDYLQELRAPSRARLEAGPPWSEVIRRGPFGEVHEHEVPHDHVLDRAALLDNARSVSWIASRPTGEREEVLRRLDELLTEDGPFSVPNLAHAMWAVRV
jgi:SAM-dependent methyltransferase